MTHDDLKGVFGKFEMECAAARVVTVLEGGRQSVRYPDMADGEERTGFLWLIKNGWLDEASPVFSSDDWLVTDGFRARVRRPGLGVSQRELFERPFIHV